MTDRRLALPLLALAAALAPAAARAATLTIDDPLVSRSECLAASSTELSLSWDLGTSTGASVELLGSDAAGCSETDATTSVLVDGLSTSQTSYPLSSDTAITVQDVLSAAGKSTTCDGSSVRVYVCVRLLDSSGDAVTTASAALKLDFTLPPPPVSLSVTPGEGALYVSWAEGTTTTDAPASTASYRAYAAAGGATSASAETTSTSVRIAGLQNGTTYDVWVVAYSDAGNASEASELSAGTPQPVLDFYELYQSSGGVETGGCSQGGSAGLWALAGVAALLRRRVLHRGRAAGGPPRRVLRAALLAAPALAACVAGRGPPPRPTEPPPSQPPLDRQRALPPSSVGAVLERRAELALDPQQVERLEALEHERERREREREPPRPGSAARASGSGQRDDRRGQPGGGPGGMGAPAMGGPAGGGPGAPDAAPDDRLAIRLDDLDTELYLRAEREVLAPAQRERARAIASAYREARYDARTARPGPAAPAGVSR